MGFFDSFTGKAQADQIKKSSAEATRFLDRGAAGARTDITAGADKAYGYLDPFIEGGTGANALLLNYLGVNGPEAQREAYASFEHDPGFEAEMEGGINALDRSATARGGLYSGAAIKGIHDYGRTKIGESFNRRINALAGVAGTGGAMAGTAAGVASNTGNALGNLTFGLGQQKAANSINSGNALAQAKGIGVNNLMNVAGLALKASGVGGFGMPGVK